MPKVVQKQVKSRQKDWQDRKLKAGLCTKCGKKKAKKWKMCIPCQKRHAGYYQKRTKARKAESFGKVQ